MRIYRSFHHAFSLTTILGLRRRSTYAQPPNPLSIFYPPLHQLQSRPSLPSKNHSLPPNWPISLPIITPTSSPALRNSGANPPIHRPRRPLRSPMGPRTRPYLPLPHSEPNNDLPLQTRAASYKPLRAVLRHSQALFQNQAAVGTRGISLGILMLAFPIRVFPREP